MPIPRAAVNANLGLATASMRMTHLAIDDYHDIFNSAGITQPPIPPTPSTVSFDVRWRGRAAPAKLRDATNHFEGRFIDSTATIEWSASQSASHFAFVSGPASDSTTVSGVIGRERNGRFFS
jgi:hypothetical protein